MKGAPREETLHITIRADGRVRFRELTDETLEVALELAPEDARLRARAGLKRAAPTKKRGADEKGSDRRD